MFATKTYSYFLVILLLTFISITKCSYVEANAEQDYGSYNWTKYDIEECKRIGKPMLFMIYTGYSSSCRYFRETMIESSNEMLETSKQFLMTRSDDLDFTRQEMFMPDGEYFPRIFFFDPSGNLMLDIFNENVPEDYKYYYESNENVFLSMKKVLERIGMNDSEEQKGNRNEF